MTHTYHVGILQRGHTAVFQFRESIDCLSCEILEYLGERETTKTAARSRLKDPTARSATLATLNAQYPTKQFKYVVID